jgi:hypothetical protein
LRSFRAAGEDTDEGERCRIDIHFDSTKNRAAAAARFDSTPQFRTSTERSTGSTSPEQPCC